MLQYPILTGLAVVMPFMAWAATQGTLGSTSTMSMTMSGTLAVSVRISHLSDINLGTFTGQTQLQASEAVCVYVSNGSAYSVLFNGTNTPGSFELSDGYGHTVAYSVDFDNSGTGTNYQPVTANSPLSGLAGASTSGTCSGSTNANIRVTLYQVNVTAPSGTYTDTLSVTVSPN